MGIVFAQIFLFRLIEVFDLGSAAAFHLVD